MLDPTHNPNLTMHKTPRLEPPAPPSKLPPSQETSNKPTQMAVPPSKAIQMAQGLWRGASRAATQSANFMGRYFVTRELGLIGVSAACAYLGTYILGELPWNAASSVFNFCGLDDRKGWISLNAPGMAILGAATVPVFQITNKFLKPATFPDGEKKNEYFDVGDAVRMAQGSASAFLSAKIGEIFFSIPSLILHIFAAGNPNPLLSAGFGIGSAVLLDDGISGLQAPEHSNKKRFAKVEIALGTAGVAYTIFKTLYTYMRSSASFQWASHSAVGMASRGAIGVPVNLLLGQITNLIPKSDYTALRLLTQLGTITTSIVVSSAISHQLGLPGANLEDPRNTFLGIVYAYTILMGIPYCIQKGLPAILDLLYPKESSISEADVTAFRRDLLLIPQKGLILHTIQRLPVR